MKTKLLLSSAMVIAVCICLIAGSTFALFTATSDVNIAVTAGDLEVKANFVQESMETKSLGQTVFTDCVKQDNGTYVGEFVNGGKATFATNETTQATELVMNGMTPGDGVRFLISAKNEGNVAVKHTVRWTLKMTDENSKLNASDALTVTVVPSNANGEILGQAFNNANRDDA
ncbi:MAG: hypothetical protein J6V39_02180, partial [Clostridia bacterium]|nr:hypothetical protein [Clostridia bacterium]